MKTAADILRAARGLLADPDRWTTKAYARAKDGRLARPEGAEAVCWCAFGALAKVGSNEWSHPGGLLRRSARALFNDLPTGVNDQRGHADVLAMYDRAIELAEAQS